jgi:UDP-3-O-[3-hydroxymyristoyl] N-acetylglucosamine deacetylase
MSVQQQTITNTIHLSGIGLHAGCEVSASLLPAPENHGIVFRRVDLTPPVELAIKPDHIQEALLCTKLVHAGADVATIEHIMAAFAAMQIDNVIVELNAPEVPVMDGSAEPFVFAIRAAGIKKQQANRRYLKIKKIVRVEDGDKYAEFSPHTPGLRLHLTAPFAHPAIQKTKQEIVFDLTSTGFTHQVSRARTFGAAKDLDQLHAKKLGLGASLENAVGLSEDAVLNPEGLRYPDEFVRHKLLDCIGDLYVAGPMIGLFRGHKTGHTLNNRLLRAVLADPEAFEWIE